MPASEKTKKAVAKTFWWKDSRRILKDCGGIMDENGLDVKRVAAAAGLHPTTVKNLFQGNTVYFQWRTMACAMGALGYGVVEKKRRGLSAEEKETIIAAQKALYPKRRKKRRGGKRKKA
jgi:hypothetical protein